MKRFSVFESKSTTIQDPNSLATNLILEIKAEYNKNIAPRADGTTDQTKKDLIERMSIEISTAAESKNPVAAYRILKAQLGLAVGIAAGCHSNRIVEGGAAAFRNWFAAAFNGNSQTKSALQSRLEALIERLNAKDSSLRLEVINYI